MRVEFHTEIAEPIAFACRLLRKAYRAGARLAVFAPAPTLSRLDEALWTFDAHEFVPHARWTGAPRGLERTPIWLVEPGVSPLPPCTASVNLGSNDVEAFAAFDRLIEVVSPDADSVREARRRWRRYREQGVEVVHHGRGTAVEQESVETHRRKCL